MRKLHENCLHEGSSQNRDVLAIASRSQHAAVSLDGGTMASRGLAQLRDGGLLATLTAPSKMEVQSRGAVAAVVNRMKHQKLGLMFDDGNVFAGLASRAVWLQRN